MRGRPRIAVEKRFWPKVKKLADDSCWLWTASINNKGNGNFHNGRGKVEAHRVSYELAFGKIPPGRFVVRRCGVQACVNPSHLFLGCGGHNTKLTFADVVAIRASSEHVKVLAERHCVSRTHITQIRLGKKWSNNWVVP